ncbi:MAG: helix-turn-helix domain-containing protein [Clostridia bacterium]|nr:helix-turn-helix domain-containing protein [Clostridia bacterium]
MEVERYKNREFSHTIISNKRIVSKVHYHDEYELYYLVHGETNYFIRDEIFKVKEGDFVFVPKGVIHNTDSEECLNNERILLSFSDSILTAEASEHIKVLSKEKLIYIPQKSRHIVEELLNKIKNEYENKPDFSKELINLYTLEILVLLCRLKETSTRDLDETERIIQSISEYISSNFHQDLTLKSLSRKFAMSEGHLSRKFKSISGMGLCEYITFVRIHNAAKLLSQTDYSLTEISSMCGFNDSNYFSSVFKKIKGTTPYKYSKYKKSL